MAKRDTKETENYGSQDVSGKSGPLSVACEIQCLQAKAGKRCIASADSDHYETPRLRRYEHASIRPGKCREKPDEGGTDDIHDHGPPGKRLANDRGRESLAPVTRHAAERTAQSNPQIR